MPVRGAMYEAGAQRAKDPPCLLTRRLCADSSIGLPLGPGKKTRAGCPGVSEDPAAGWACERGAGGGWPVKLRDCLEETEMC